jgi:hypothetical protein
VPLEEPHDIFAVVDDGDALSECHEDNNLADIDGVRCPPIIG